MEDDTDTDTDSTEGGPAPAEPQDAEETPAPPATLAGGRLSLRTPTAIAERWDLYLAGQRVPEVSYLRVYAAAIALCWPDFRKMLAKANIVYGGNVVEYGGRVQSILFAGTKPAREPVDHAAFLQAGAAAMALINQSIVSGEAVEAARGFT